MKFERKHKLGIALGIAVLLILYGLLSSVFHFNFDPKTVNNVTTILMAVALWMVFSLRTKNNSPDQTQENRDLQDSSENKEERDSLQDADTSAESNTEHDNNYSSETDDNSSDND